MKRRRSISEKPALDLIDEAFALLRRCPPAVGLLYYVGTLPYVLGFLYFWTDMSRGAFAQEHLVEGSLLVAVGFVWAKVWQGFFSAHLMALASRRELPPWTPGRVCRVAAAQVALQPSGLFILPVAAVAMLPLAAAVAFYQNVSAVALDTAGEPQSAGAVRREALAQAGRWPRQNHTGLAVLYFFGLAVFANILIMIVALPSLLKTLLGIDTMFSRDTFSMLNTTVAAAAMGITYLCVDPIFKAFYALRCFRGRSIATGEDLRVRMLPPARLGAVAGIALFFLASVAGRADFSVGPAPPANSGKINASIERVLNRPEFAWRAPRETVDDDKGTEGSFFTGMTKMLNRWLGPLKRAMKRLGRWVDRHMSHQPVESSPGNSGASWGAALQVFAWVFCILAVGALIGLGIKVFLELRRPEPVAAEPGRIVPDLTSEDVVADQLPEDEWMRMAREMAERGEMRLALRALFLAALAHLGKSGFISIARHKSNLEYQRELRRRRPAEGELIAAFGETIGSFERGWYGMHEVNEETLSASETNLERIRQA